MIIMVCLMCIVGLFLEGKRSAASVVAIYPGVVYHPGVLLLLF